MMAHEQSDDVSLTIKRDILQRLNQINLYSDLIPKFMYEHYLTN
jgi:hypothetical protein